MLGKTFYYGTVRKIIVAFGALFNDIVIERADSDGTYLTVEVPLIYSPKEKFIRRIREVAQPNSDEVWIKETLPRMGFELNAMAYAPERKLNTMERLTSLQGQPKFMYNRVPYNFTFSLYIGTRKFDDSLRIVEQIVPYFTPEFTVKIVDKEDFDITTNVPYVLDAIDYVIEDDASMEDGRRSIMWTLQFTAKGYMYAAVTPATLIKKSIIDLTSLETDRFFESYMAEVDPKEANEDEPHEIIETISDVPRDSYTLLGGSGQQANIDALD